MKWRRDYGSLFSKSNRISFEIRETSEIPLTKNVSDCDFIFWFQNKVQPPAIIYSLILIKVTPSALKFIIRIVKFQKYRLDTKIGRMH